MSPADAETSRSPSSVPLHRLGDLFASVLTLVLLMALVSQDISRKATPITPQAAAAPADTRININAATQEELETLPGIGPVLARSILKRRPYKTPRKLSNVPGLGPKRVEKLLPLIHFGPEKAPDGP